jgi:hypothetical protein
MKKWIAILSLAMLSASAFSQTPAAPAAPAGGEKAAAAPANEGMAKPETKKAHKTKKHHAPNTGHPTMHKGA